MEGSMIVPSTLLLFSSIIIIITSLHLHQVQSFTISTPLCLHSRQLKKARHHSLKINHQDVVLTTSSSSFSFLVSSLFSSSQWDDSNAESQFGTKTYWDDMYQGMGDFSSEEYSWYFGWGELKSYFTTYAPQPLPSPILKRTNKKTKKNGQEKEGNDVIEMQQPKVLIPGIGNDGILIDLYSHGYRDITAFDYSQGAIDRQVDLLSYYSNAIEYISLYVQDARELKDDWTETYDLIFEKGALDAIYLSGDGYVDLAIRELTRVVKKGGIFMSVSGVVPEDLRRKLITTEEWEWIRDGSDDLKAGVFVWKRR